MATKNKISEREKILKTLRDQSAILADHDLEQIEQNFTSRERLRRTLLNSLKLTGEELIELAENGSVKDGQVFAQLVDEAPELAMLHWSCGTITRNCSSILRRNCERVCLRSL